MKFFITNHAPLVFLAGIICTAEAISRPSAIAAMLQQDVADDPTQQAAVDRFNQTRRTYANMQSYQDTMTVSLSIDDGKGELPIEEARDEVELKFQRPNMAAIDARDSKYFSNGTSECIVKPYLSQYKTLPAAESLSSRNSNSFAIDGPLMRHPLISLLLGVDESKGNFLTTSELIIGMTPELRDGRPGQRIRAIANISSIEAIDEGMAIPLTLWIDDAMNVIKEITYDMTQPITQSLDDQPGQLKRKNAATYIFIVTFDDIQIDQTIDPEEFTWQPEAGYDLVEQFENETGTLRGTAENSQHALVNNAAPQFAGQDLAGKDITLRSLDSKIVILDFWATWSAPCVRALPGLQNVVNDYQNQNVRYVGINQDAPGSEDMIKSFLNKRELALQTIVDDGTIANNYDVISLPVTVIISADGIVAAVIDEEVSNRSEVIRKVIDRLLNE